MRVVRFLSRMYDVAIMTVVVVLLNSISEGGKQRYIESWLEIAEEWQAEQETAAAAVLN